MIEPGRILYLAEDAALVAAQLAGQALAAPPPRLRDDISTDEITPLPSLAFHDARLAEHVHTGLACGEARPVGVGAVRRGGFAVVVAGRRYGKGSSREHSPLAERLAGVRLVVAESFERIYRQNADNLGLFTTTDFALLARLRRGEPVAVEALVADRDPLAAAILRAGGLLRFGRARLGALPAMGAHLPGPRTYAEKIIARHALAMDGLPAPLRPGEAGFVKPDLRFIHDAYTAMAGQLLDDAFGSQLRLHDPAGILAFEDHYSYAHRSEVHARRGLLAPLAALGEGHRAFAARFGLRNHGRLPEGEGSEGISHALVAERYALPGQLIVGTDSHTPHSGALGCLAYGVGTTDMANAMVTGAARLRVPETLRVELRGRLAPGVAAKDVALHLLARPDIRAGLGVGRVFEFGGPGLAALDTDGRATLTNMTAELGGFAGLVEPDAETVRFLRERRGIDVTLADWMRSDPGAAYAAVIDLDLGTVAPMLAAPGDPGNGVTLAAAPEGLRIDIAYGGSCTAGKLDDFARYHEVLAWAAAQGLRVAPHVRLYLQFGTVGVREACAERGWLAAFDAVGAELLQPGCGACANCGPGASTEPGQVTVSAVNRNFPGRFGPGKVWLASPQTVAASAIAGEIMGFDRLRARAG